MFNVKSTTLYRYLLAHLRNSPETLKAAELVHRVMSPDPWPGSSGLVNVNFTRQAVSEALDRTNINLVVASRSQLFSGLPSWLGSPTEIFDEMVSLRIGLFTLHSAVQERHLGKRSLRCKCCGLVDGNVSKLLKTAYPAEPTAGSIAITNRFSVMVCYLTLLALGDRTTAAKLENLVVSYERSAVLGEPPNQPGLFLVQSR